MVEKDNAYAFHPAEVYCAGVMVQNLQTEPHLAWFLGAEAQLKGTVVLTLIDCPDAATLKSRCRFWLFVGVLRFLFFFCGIDIFHTSNLNTFFFCVGCDLGHVVDLFLPVTALLCGNLLKALDPDCKAVLFAPASFWGSIQRFGEAVHLCSMYLLGSAQKSGILIFPERTAEIRKVS